VVQTDIRTPTGTLRTWHWYWVGGDFASSPTTAKLLELKHKVFGGVDAAADLVVSTPIRTEPEEASEELRRFLEAALPSLEGLLSDAAARGAGRSGS
jgi:EpsI family protein